MSPFRLRSAWTSVVAATALLVAAGLGAAMMGAAAVGGVQELRDEAATFKRAAARAEGLVAAAESASDGAAAEAEFVHVGAAVAEVQAQMRETLKKAAEQSGVALGVARASEPRKALKYDRLDLVFEAAAPPQSLGAFLAALEAQRPKLFITQIEARQGRANVRTPLQRDVDLSISLYALRAEEPGDVR